MYECVPGGIAIPKSLTNGTSLFSCTSSLMPAPGFGPIMYSYCSMFIRSRRPRSAPGTWCRHDMETLSPLVGLCKGNPPITSTFPSQFTFFRKSPSWNSPLPIVSRTRRYAITNRLQPLAPLEIHGDVQKDTTSCWSSRRARADLIIIIALLFK